MRLPETIRAAFVIGRRDFVATVFSKTFLFFLLGPLFPLVIAVLFSGIGAQVDKNTTSQTVAVTWSPPEFDRLVAAQKRLAPILRGGALELERIDPLPDADRQRDDLLRRQGKPIVAVLDGSLDAPRLTGALGEGDGRAAQIELIIDDARRPAALEPPRGTALTLDPIRNSAASVAFLRGTTARAGQAILFFATLLLAGMLLSQLIEEKANKVIEVLASAVPVDAIFLGKLFAMLAMSLVGISVWTATAIGGFYLAIGDGLAAIPAPAVGWPLFIVLLLVYFSTSYLLIGAVFLGIGAHASTPREVQTMSMPVTMSQVLLFGFASLAVGRGNAPEAIAAAVFPLSSPFAMIARAAESPALWPHLVALLWQALWVALILRLSARVFRRSVLKSGKRFRWPFRGWLMAAIAALGFGATN